MTKRDDLFKAFLQGHLVEYGLTGMARTSISNTKQYLWKFISDNLPFNRGINDIKSNSEKKSFLSIFLKNNLSLKRLKMPWASVLSRYLCCTSLCLCLVMSFFIVLWAHSDSWLQPVVCICFFITQPPYRMTLSWRHIACSSLLGTRVRFTCLI